MSHSWKYAMSPLSEVILEPALTYKTHTVIELTVKTSFWECAVWHAVYTAYVFNSYTFAFYKCQSDLTLIPKRVTVVWGDLRLIRVTVLFKHIIQEGSKSLLLSAFTLSELYFKIRFTILVLTKTIIMAHWCVAIKDSSYEVWFKKTCKKCFCK